jgi:DNA invertase Pin-like site-specific DNA recombinase
MMYYIAYYRVSTSKQGQSGLGLEAQKQIVKTYIEHDKERRVIMSFQDIESGKKNTRPQLMKAIEACKKFNCTLLIAKLDRLSRNASFILTLRDNAIKFQALDIPEANTLTIGIFATIAQHERELISQRTKDALKALKARGVKLGRPENLTPDARRKALEKIRFNAVNHTNNLQAAEMIKHLRKDGDSFRQISHRLNELGYRTRYKGTFHPITVQRLWRRCQSQGGSPNTLLQVL